MNFRATGKGVAGIRTHLSMLVCCGAVLAGLLAATGADGAIFRPGAHQFKQKVGVFRVSIHGVQVNRWSQDRQPVSECDISSKGSGFERIRFHTPARRMRIVAFGEGRANSAVFKPLPMRGKVTRRGKLVHGSTASLPDHCFADGGGDPPPPPPRPDCGTKAIRGARLAPFALDGKLSLDLARTKTPPKLFRNCAWVGRVWPALLTRRGNGSQVSTGFSPRWVFNPKFNRRTGAWSKVIMIARGANTGRSFGTWYKTRIRWTVTMKRLR